MLRLDKKIAAVTGIGSPDAPLGNGRAIAELFARQGAVIEGIDIFREDGQRTQDAVTAAGGACQLTIGSVTDEADVNHWIESIIARHGRIDILVNNVGQSERMLPQSADSSVWQKQLELNLTSAMMTCRAVLPHMLAAGCGAIVNISSIAGIRYLGKPQIAYSAAKAGLIQYTRSSAVIHAANNIRMNCVLPGLMHTAMVERMAEKYAAGDYDGFVKKRHNQVPAGKMGTASDVAHAALFLAADESRYITGTELVVDGGITATIPE